MKFFSIRGVLGKAVQTAVIVSLIVSSINPVFAGERKKEEKSKVGLVFCLGMVAAGSIFSYYQYTAAKEDYGLYRKSAFTDNTAVLRQDVRRHDLLCIIGGVAAGVGAIGVVVSF
jgi:hypothetical protein